MTQQTRVKLHGATYLRISRVKGENEDTLQNHMEILQEFLRNDGHTYDTYSEIISGGKHSIEERPELEKLISNIDKYDAVFCISLDRLARNGVVSQQIKQLCIDNEVLIVTPSQTYDLANKQEDRILYDVSSMFATMEYEMIGKRNKLNKMQRASRGEWVSGGTAFGYMRNEDTKKLEIYETEAKVVRYIFELYGEGLGSRRIVDRLNDEGYRTKRSNAFTTSTIKKIITNPVYKGTIQLLDKKRVKENGKFISRVVDTISTPNSHPAIIPLERWEQANRERTDRTETARIIREKPSKVMGTASLKDLLFCGNCGRKLSIRTEPSGSFMVRRCEKHNISTGERCNNSGIKHEYIETDIFAMLMTRKQQLQDDLFLLEQEDTTAVETDLSGRLLHIENEIQHNTAQQKKLLELAMADVFSLDEIRERKQKLFEQLQTLENAKVGLLEQINAIDIVSYKERITKTINLLKIIDTLDPPEQNEALKQFIKRINYTRQIPTDIKKLSTRNPERRFFPFVVKIEFF